MCRFSYSIARYGYLIMMIVAERLPRLGKRELILSFTCNFVVSVRRGFLFLSLLGIACVILLWHFLGLPYNYRISFKDTMFLNSVHISVQYPCYDWYLIYNQPHVQCNISLFDNFQFLFNRFFVNLILYRRICFLCPPDIQDFKTESISFYKQY